MAALMRPTFRFSQKYLRLYQTRFSNKNICSVLPLQHISKRLISTSNKNKEDTAMPHILERNDLPEVEKSKIEQEVAEETKDWVSYGFHYTDKQEDIARWYWSMFWIISVTVCGITFIFNYAPDPGLRDWARREAYLELERRERLRLPLVDPDVIPVENVTLPSEEMLGDDYPIIV